MFLLRIFFLSVVLSSLVLKARHPIQIEKDLITIEKFLEGLPKDFSGEKTEEVVERVRAQEMVANYTGYEFSESSSGMNNSTFNSNFSENSSGLFGEVDGVGIVFCTIACGVCGVWAQVFAELLWCIKQEFDVEYKWVKETSEWDGGKSCHFAQRAFRRPQKYKTCWSWFVDVIRCK